MNLLYAMLNTVLPVFLMAGLGWIARRYLQVDVRDPSRLAVYLLSPALVVNSILGAHTGATEVGKILAFGLLLMVVMIAITLTVGRLLGWSLAMRNAAVLNTGFMNAANYGLPVILFAFGQDGFERAMVLVVLETVLMYSVAVYFAASGRMAWRPAVRAVFTLPLIWATGLALLIRALGIVLPEAVLKPLALLANGSLVLAIILLGMQVANIRLRGATLNIGLAALLRLVVSPLVGLAIVALLRPDHLTAQVLVLEAAMPAAVSTTLLAVQFEAEPDVVAGGTLVSTVASLITVSFWVWYLQR